MPSKTLLNSGMMKPPLPSPPKIVESPPGPPVLATVVALKEAQTGKDFLPLTVDYQERTYAAGRIPGGFFKREGRPSEKEILTSRLIDRPIRPLFAKGFAHETQVIATVKSIDPEIDPDIVAMLGASAALALSGIPFNGPIGAARVGYANGQYILNPTTTQLKTSQMDLVVAGTEHAIDDLHNGLLRHEGGHTTAGFSASGRSAGRRASEVANATRAFCDGPTAASSVRRVLEVRQTAADADQTTGR